MNTITKCCGNCRFAVMDPPGAERQEGKCHRYPPTAVMIMVAMRSVANPNGEQRMTPAAIRPPILADWWCGEWQEAGPKLTN